MMKNRIPSPDELDAKFQDIDELGVYLHIPFCEQICPTGAIEVDWGPMAKLHDKYIKILLSKRLDKAEAAGYFRRLVPVENIGWKTHWFEISKHPRYKIK